MTTTLFKCFVKIRYTLILGLSALIFNAFSEPVLELTSEKKLELIRRELLESALESPTLVKSTSWIDSNGTLRQSSSFKNDMKVRGIKVLAYELKNKTANQRKVYWDGVVEDKKIDSKKPSPTHINIKDKDCLGQSNLNTFKHLLTFTVDSSSSWSTDSLPVTRELETTIHNSLIQINKGKKSWYLDWQDNVSMTSYEKVLTSSQQVQTPWSARLTISPKTLQNKSDIPNILQRFITDDAISKVSAQLHFILSSTKTNEVLFEQINTVPLALIHQPWSSPELRTDTIEEIRKITKAWSNSMTNKFACLDFHPVVSVLANNDIRMNAGKLSGVSLGDEWLLVDSKHIPHRIMEDGNLKQTVLASVRKVGLHDSELEILAGPKESIKGNWLALPTLTKY